MYALNVNGKSYSVDVDAATPLLWTLRDVLGLTGTKYGCGIEICGACTVLVDGEPKKSCDMDTSSAAGKKIVTIEGLSKDRSHPGAESMDREAGSAVRLLPVRDDHVVRRSAWRPATTARRYCRK